MLGMQMLIDTHVLVWLALADRKLGSKARITLDKALQAHDDVAVSAVSFWEMAMLVAKGRLDLDPEATRTASHRAGIREVPLNGAIAIRAATLADFHGDPADRFIVATSLSEEVTLMTADRLILRWKGLTTVNAEK
jgi:PIN domain nuclease of toxin-antitoxin system